MVAHLQNSPRGADVQENAIHEGQAGPVRNRGDHGRVDAGFAAGRRRGGCPPVDRVDDLSVSTKIFVAVLTGLLVAVAIGLLGLYGLRETSRATQSMYRNNVAGVSAIGRLRAAAFKTRVDVANHAISQDQASMAKYRVSIGEDQKSFSAACQRRLKIDPLSSAVSAGHRKDGRPF